MPYKTDKMNLKQLGLPDRRLKLTPEQRAEIHEGGLSGSVSLRGLSRQYGVSRRLVQFICWPERQEKANENHDWRNFHDKAKFNASVRKHRNYKRYGGGV
jgi:hypothetical protein